jgi:osmoprotectant transport system ATP-binding protein
VIRFEAVSRVFPRGESDSVTALDNLTLDIRAGETLALLGPSGCGKTTTLRLLNRLLEPSSGHIFVDEVDTATVDPVALRRRMGYVVQRGGLFPHLTVARNIGLLPELEGWSRGRIAARVDELLSLVRLPPDEFRDRFPKELSGGQQQRVGVARALALDPEFLLMDEPFGALDPITRKQLQQEFLELDSLIAKTVVLVSHDLDEAFLLGDRVALLNAGRLVQVGTPDDLQNDPSSDWVRSFVHGHAS